MIGFSEDVTDRNFIDVERPLDKAIVLQKTRLLTSKSSTVEVQYSTLVMLLHYFNSHTSFDFTKAEYSDVFFTLTRVFQPYGPDGASGTSQGLTTQQWAVQRLVLSCLDFLADRTDSPFFITRSLTRLIEQNFAGLVPQSVRLLGKIALDASFSEVQKLLRVCFSTAITQNDRLLVSSSAVACDVFNKRPDTASTVSLQDQATSALMSALQSRPNVSSGHVVASLGADRICEKAEKIASYDNPHASYAAVAAMYSRLRSIFGVTGGSSSQQVDTGEVMRIVDAIAYFLPKISAAPGGSPNSNAGSSSRKSSGSGNQGTFITMAAPIEAIHAFLFLLQSPLGVKLAAQLNSQRGVDVPRITMYAITSLLRDYCRTSCSTMVGMRLASQFAHIVLMNPAFCATSSSLSIDEIILFVDQVRSVVRSFQVTNAPITAVQQECLATAAEIVDYADTTYVYSNEIGETELDILVSDIKLVMALLLLMKNVDSAHRLRFKDVAESICTVPYAVDLLNPLVSILVGMLDSPDGAVGGASSLKQVAFDILATIAVVDTSEKTSALAEIISHFDDCIEDATVKRICELIGNHYENIDIKSPDFTEEDYSAEQIRLPRIIAALWTKAQLGAPEVQLACAVALGKLKPVVRSIIPLLEGDILVILEKLKRASSVVDVAEVDKTKEFGINGLDAILETSMGLMMQPNGGSSEIAGIADKIGTLLSTLPKEAPLNDKYFTKGKGSMRTFSSFASKINTGDLVSSGDGSGHKGGSSSSESIRQQIQQTFADSNIAAPEIIKKIIVETLLKDLIHNPKTSAKYPEIMTAFNSCGSEEEFIKKAVSIFCAEDEYSQIDTGDYEISVKAYKVFVTIASKIYLSVVYMIENNPTEVPMFDIKLTTFVLLESTKNKARNIPISNANSDAEKIFASELIPIYSGDLNDEPTTIVESVCDLSKTNTSSTANLEGKCHIGSVLKFAVSEEEDAEVETIKLEEMVLQPRDFIVAGFLPQTKLELSNPEKFEFVLHDIQNETEVVERLPDVLKLTRKVGTGKFGDSSVEMSGILCGVGFVKVIGTTSLYSKGGILLSLSISVEQKLFKSTNKAVSNIFEYLLH